ncbi:MAG: DUF5996 family protein [bacterium]|nr:DUF5996 family protein [bacterium]
MTLHPIDPQAKLAMHNASKILLTIRLLGVDPLPNGLRHSLLPALGESALTTGALTFGGELRLDFINPGIHHIQNGEILFDIPLNGHSQKSLFKEVYAQYAKLGISLMPPEISATYIIDDAPFEFSSQATNALYDTMVTMYGWIASAKARFLGFQTPLVWWAHGFDLSCLWFMRGIDDHKDPHLNIGFSPGTPDIGDAYLYFYTSPTLPDMENNLPNGMKWTGASWHYPGGFLSYTDIMASSDPADLVMSTVWTIYKTVNAMMK